MYALGFIETKGLVGAIKAADAMLKAADVFLVEKNQVGSGLVTITVAGEVSAVQASVEAAAAALARIEGAQLVSKHVIARHFDELSNIIATGSPVPAVEEKEPEAEIPEESAVEANPVSEKSAEATEETGQYKISQLKKMRINRVRQIARNLSGISLSPEEVRKAPKKTLIEAILNVTRKIEE